MKNLWNTKDLADFLGKSPQWVRENVNELSIPALKLGQQWRFDPDDIYIWIKTNN